jgi:hypothetical protein
MRSPFILPLCFKTSAPALTGYGQHDQFANAAPGHKLGCLKRRANCPQTPSTNTYIPGQKPFMVVISFGYLPDFRANQTTQVSSFASFKTPVITSRPAAVSCSA